MNGVECLKLKLNEQNLKQSFIKQIKFMVMVLNTTFNNISVILWMSDLLAEETGVPWENHWSAASHWQTLTHNVVSSTQKKKNLKKYTIRNLFFFFIKIDPKLYKKQSLLSHDFVEFRNRTKINDLCDLVRTWSYFWGVYILVLLTVVIIFHTNKNNN